MQSATNFIKQIANYLIDPLPRRYLRRLKRVRSQPVDLPAGKRAYIFLAADYDNLGDVAITLAQKELLQEIFPTHRVTEVPTGIPFPRLKYLLEQIGSEDVITLIGGGNMGVNYYHFQCLRECILRFLPRETKIYSFPQTIDFTPGFIGRSALETCKKSYGSSDKLILMAREKQSYDFFRNNFSAQTFLTPDVVMTLKRWQRHGGERKGVGFAFRQDREKVVSDAALARLRGILQHHGIEQIDTASRTKNWSEDAKYELLENYLSQLSQKKLLVTDRLHGMIFAYITGTPAIVFPNSNGKIKYCHEWIRECGFIHFADSPDTVDAALVEKVMASAIDFDLLESKRRSFITIFRNIFHAS